MAQALEGAAQIARVIEVAQASETMRWIMPWSAKLVPAGD